MTKRKAPPAPEPEIAPTPPQEPQDPPPPHVHTTLPVRCCPDESVADVLWKLRANEPLWTPRLLSEAHPEAKNPSLSASGETRETFQQRHKAWQTAVDRETAKESGA